MTAASFFVLLSLITAFLFFVFIPGLGAFSVRAKWRRFRARIVKASTFSIMDYSDLSKDNEGSTYRFFGTLEAIQDTNKIWLRSGDVSAAADLEDVPVYILPSYSSDESLDEALSDEEPQSVPWKQISSLPAGVHLFVAGALYLENGRAIFRSESQFPLLVVIFDGGKETILRRAIRSGRQRNEYWNQYTLISLITGSFALLLLTYVFLGNPATRLPALISLTLSVSPLAVLLPPGVAFLYLYRFFWKRARTLRAERDLQRLPLRYFKGATNRENSQVVSCLPDGEQYIMLRGKSDLVTSKLSPADRGALSPVHLTMTPSGNEIYLFGARSQIENRLTVPLDPMAELTMIQGNPEENAMRCSKRAMMFTLLSGAFLSLDLFPNLFLILILFRMLIP
jgi:hypothetical protein